MYSKDVGPLYWICFDEAAKIVGGNFGAAMAILRGEAALHEMPKGSPAEKAAWARSKWDEAHGEGDFDWFFSSQDEMDTTNKGASS